MMRLGLVQWREMRPVGVLIREYDMISQKLVDDYRAKKYENGWTEEAMKDRYNWVVGEIGKILDVNVNEILRT